MKKGNLAIFIPHVGCPHNCAFCNQWSISNTESPPTAEEVGDLCNKFLPEKDSNIEIAFFGGSFTAIPQEYMQEILETACHYVKAGRATGIRISTRPDYINENILNILKNYEVTSIELGAQSMNNEILAKIERGHTAQDLVKASRLINEHGFSLGLQMMIGLPFEDNYEKEALQTAIQIAELKPDTVRIYPAITLKDTQMELWYRNGEYKPLNVEQAVNISAKLLQLFEEKSINVIRVGLHADEGLENAYVAGPYHPAFRQLCEAYLYRTKLETTLAAIPQGRYTISVAKGELSTAIGQKKDNVLYFSNCGYQLEFEEIDSIPKGTYNIQPRSSE
jgi:Histone acetyltransferase